MADTDGRQRLVERDEFARSSRTAAAVDLAAFRADQDAAVDSSPGDYVAEDPTREDLASS